MAAILHEPPRALACADEALGSAVAPVLARAMSKAPEDRYPDIDAFADALARAAGLSTGETMPVARVITPAPSPEALAHTEADVDLLVAAAGRVLAGR